MKVINKTQRQQNECRQFNNIKSIWKISLDYSRLLYNNLNKRDILFMVDNIYNQYIQSLRSNRLINLKNKNNHIEVWNTMMNTCNNSKLSEDFKKGCIKQLYYTSLKKINNYN
jgi:hypothetical protein